MPDTDATETTKPPGPSSKSIARYDGPRTIEDLERFAMLLAVNTMPDGSTRRNETLPVAFRGNPAGVAFATEYAKALDVSPVTALIGMHIIDGKPTASAGLISALVRRAGHRIRTWTTGSISAGNFEAITTIERFDDPGFVYESRWDLDRAVRAKLMKRDGGRIVAMKSGSGWDNYPENMCKSRTITEAARDAAEDAILGVHYTPEELGVDVDETGEPVYTVTTLPEHPENMREAAQDAAQRAAETMRAQSPADPGSGAQEAAETPSEIPLEVVDQVRAQILAATTREHLTAAWSSIGSEALFRSTMVGDEHDAEISLYDLFGRAVEACKAGTAPLRKPDDGQAAEPDPTPAEDPDGAVDADVVEDQPTAGSSDPRHNHGIEDPCERGCPRYDPWATPDERLAGEHAEPEPAAEPEAHDVPSVQIGDVRHGVAIPGDATAAERAEALRHLPPPDAKAELDRIMTALPKYAQAEVIEWAKAQGINPTHSAGNCAELAGAIAIGNVFSDATLSAFAAGDGEDPIRLVIRVLGGEVLSTEHHDQAEQHRRELDERLTEDHVDASSFTTARRGTAFERSEAARQAARDAVRQSQQTR